jgi:hypothetical protein
VLHPLDDHPVHQTPEPLVHPATGDRNFYDRFFFNGYTRDGSLYFGIAFGTYPNRALRDAAFSVVWRGRQVSLHASREAGPRDPLKVGPIAIEIEVPMRTLRVRIAPNEWGLEADLRFHARTPAVEEPRFVRREQGRLLMDVTRFTQFGTWEGVLSVAGERIPVEPARVPGTRDRSWGIRPIGERAPGPMPAAPQFFWLWAPLHFEDCCTHFDVNEDAAGARWHENGMVVPLLAPDGDPTDCSKIEVARAVDHRLRWRSGTRRAEGAELVLTMPAGRRREIALEPILDFAMLGIGYLHPEWAHGTWKGPEAVAGETWEAAAVSAPSVDPRFLHVQQLCRARLDGREGIGVLEQLVIGPHAPSGFTALLDGAPLSRKGPG